jgi:pimeloyl-ACP methyl ester carboxylesterase
MRIRTGLIGALAVCSMLIASCTTTIPDQTGSGTTTSPASSGMRDRSGGHGEKITWKSCQGSFECGTLEVPLDWSDPQGEHIELALIRKPARSGHPIGSLLMNPGGPGQPGTEFLPQLLSAGEFPDELADRFDLMSWDPRGTGNSAGVACLTDADFTDPEPLPYPPTAAERAAVAAKAEAQQDRCLDVDGKVIPHVGTIATVEDLDAIRAAVGDTGLTYVGFSYGTTIGLEYLRRYPDRVRAIVLDGVALPGTDPVATTKAQMTSFEDNLDRFLDACKADASCAFGGDDPHGALLAFLDRLATGVRIPASYSLPDESGERHDRAGTLGYTEAVTGIAAALYNQQTWSVLRSGLASATRPGSPDGHLLLTLRDLLVGRQLDGTWNHSTEANQAISCADQSERATSMFGDPARIGAWAKDLPVFGAFGAAGLPGCYRWPKAIQPLHELTGADLAGAPGVVIVNSSHDPATPYANAEKAHALMPASRLVTWEGDDHTSFGSGHDCIDDAVVPYLVDGRLPRAGIRCASGGD